MHANQVKFHGGLNHLNICYASFDIVDGLSNFQNLNFIVPNAYYPLMILQKTMIFFDTQNMA